MADDLSRVTGIKHRLVKWDGEGPIPDDASEMPQKYPQVAEVIEGGDGLVTKVIYRRKQHATD